MAKNGKSKAGARPEKQAGASGKEVASSAIAARLAKVSAGDAATVPNKPVKVALLEAERLEAGLKPHKKALLALPGFDASDLSELGALTAALSDAERTWDRIRIRRGEDSLTAMRKDAEAWRRDALAAGRYLLRKDKRALGELDRIAEGEGLADLVADLGELRTFIADHPQAFEALEKPIDVAAAEKLASGLGQGGDGPAASEALSARNRAYWALDSAVTEIRAGLRFLLRHEPKKLASLLSQFEAQKRARQRKAAASTSETPPDAPEI